MTWHHQIAHVKAKTRAKSGDYVWLVVLRDVFLALGFLVVAFFAAVFFEAGFFNAAFRFPGFTASFTNTERAENPTEQII